VADLARRAVAAGFRWEAGAVSLPDKHGRRWRMRKYRKTVEPMLEWKPVLRCPAPPLADLLPDLTDAATLGVLLRQVREAWRGTVWVAPVLIAGERRWAVCGLHVSDGARVDGANAHASEAEALIAALEAAKEKTP
jgi:hypothetical protein